MNPTMVSFGQIDLEFEDRLLELSHLDMPKQQLQLDRFILAPLPCKRIGPQETYRGYFAVVQEANFAC